MTDVQRNIKCNFCLFQHRSSVTMVKFANNDVNLLACASMDGKLSICSVGDPPQILYTLEHHKSGITSKDIHI